MPKPETAAPFEIPSCQEPTELSRSNDCQDDRAEDERSLELFITVRYSTWEQFRPFELDVIPIVNNRVTGYIIGAISNSEAMDDVSEYEPRKGMSPARTRYVPRSKIRRYMDSGEGASKIKVGSSIFFS